MSIILIRGPDRVGSSDRRPSVMNKEVLMTLIERASCAGKTIAMRTCGNESEFVHALEGAKQTGAEIVLVDPGLYARSPRAVQAMTDMGLPYIEVHDDSFEKLEPCFTAGVGRRLAVASGYQAQSYTLALSMALEHLGCDECGCEVHVGT